MATVTPLKLASNIPTQFGSGDQLPASVVPLGSPNTALTNSSGTVTLDASQGDYFTLTLAANVTTLTLTNAPAAGTGRTIAILITQNATGGYTFALPSSFHAVGSSDTAIQSAANAVTLLCFTTFDGGTTWRYSMGKAT